MHTALLQYTRGIVVDLPFHKCHCFVLEYLLHPEHMPEAHRCFVKFMAEDRRRHQVLGMLQPRPDG
jgi:hypothetical protein